MKKEIKKYDFDFEDEVQEKLNIAIAVEVIKKYLYQTNKITKEDFKNVLKNANRSVKNNIQIS